MHQIYLRRPITQALKNKLIINTPPKSIHLIFIHNTNSHRLLPELNMFSFFTEISEFGGNGGVHIDQDNPMMAQLNRKQIVFGYRGALR